MNLTNFPQEIRNKILLFLSTPCADIIKEHCIYLDNIINNILIEEYYYTELINYRDNFAGVYFKERNVFCDRCNCKLFNPMSRYMIEDYHNDIFCKT
jgi:hypothetical protein